MDTILTTPQMVVEDRGHGHPDPRAWDMLCPGKLTIIS